MVSRRKFCTILSGAFAAAANKDSPSNGYGQEQRKSREGKGNSTPKIRIGKTPKGTKQEI